MENNILILNEAKADQEAFINKFGQETFDKFKKLKDRLKNKGISVDIVYHTKNTSIEKMKEILYNAEKRIEDSSEEEKKVKIAENENYVVYDIQNYKTAMKYGTGTCWCITGRYNDGHRNPHTDQNPKEDQASQYFPQYLRDQYTCFLFAIPKNNENVKYCICPYKGNPSKADIWSPSDKRYVFDLNASLNPEIKPFLRACPEIDYKGFSTKLEDFVINDGVLIQYNGDSTDVVLPDDVKEINEEVFARTNITSITINSIKKINSRSFYYCESLVKVDIKADLETIDVEAFQGCKNLEIVNLPPTLKNIELDAFKECNKVAINVVKHKIIVKEQDIQFLSRHIHWLQANESLSNSNKSLDESKLNEYFSESMPQWLRNAIEDKDPHRGYRGGWSYNGLKDALNIHNIDLANAKFIDDGTIPENARDPRLAYPNIPFFHVVSEDKYHSGEIHHQVFAKGINDDECFQIGGYSYGNKKFNSHSIKNILKYTIDFCYLDTTDPANYNKDKKSARAVMKLELDKIPNYNRGKGQYHTQSTRFISGRYYDNGNYIPGHYEPTGNWKWVRTTGQDKSGYVIDPDRYRKQLNAIGKQNYQKVLDGFYDRLNKIKQSFLDIISSLDINNARNSDYDNVAKNDLFRYYKSAVLKYNEFAENIEKAINNPNEEEKEKSLDSLFNVKNDHGWNYFDVDIDDVKNAIDYVEGSIKKYHSVTLESLNNTKHITEDLSSISDDKANELINAYNQYSEEEFDWNFDHDALMGGETKDLIELFPDGIIGIAYTTDEYSDTEYQVSYDLNDNTYKFYIDGDLVKTQYKTIDELISDLRRGDLFSWAIGECEKIYSGDSKEESLHTKPSTKLSKGDLVENQVDNVMNNLHIVANKNNTKLAEEKIADNVYKVMYANNDGRYKCPFCNSDNVDFWYYYDDDGEYRSDFYKCDDCGATWITNTRIEYTFEGNYDDNFNELENNNYYDGEAKPLTTSEISALLPNATIGEKLEEAANMNDKVNVHIYNQVETMTRKEAMDKYIEAYYATEGSEQQRCRNILMDLKAGETECFDDDDDYADYHKIKSTNKDNNVNKLEQEAIHEILDYVGDSLHEDTVKRGDFWVNKGKEGTHGKFRTKKAADAQRKAMFANGYHEGLNEEYADLEDDIKAKLEEITNEIVNRLGFDHQLVLDDLTNDFEQQIMAGEIGNGASYDQLKQALLEINPAEYAEKLASDLENKAEIRNQFIPYVTLGEMLLSKLDTKGKK